MLRLNIDASTFYSQYSTMSKSISKKKPQFDSENMIAALLLIWACDCVSRYTLCRILPYPVVC